MKARLKKIKEKELMQLNFNTFVLIDKQIKFKKNLAFVYKKY